MKCSPALFAAVWAAFGVAGLAGCGGQDLAQPARDHSAAEELAEAPVEDAAPARERQAARPPRTSDAASIRKIGGKPMWADNQRYSAQENADYQFRQHGQELDVADLDGFLVKVHGFVNDPPKGAKTIRRANGDALIWDARSGLFGVVREDGAPRTVFKPDDGDAYWAQQVRENAAGGGQASVGRSSGAGG